MPGGQEIPGSEEGDRHSEERRAEAARQKEKNEALREEKERKEAAKHEAWMKAHAAKAVYPPDMVTDALFGLLADAGIDLSIGKVARIARAQQVERMATLTGELKKLATLAKVAEGGDASLVADTAHRIRSCVSEINELTALMAAGDGKFGRDDASQPGSVDLGGAHIPTPDRIDMQQEKTVEPDAISKLAALTDDDRMKLAAASLRAR